MKSRVFLLYLVFVVAGCASAVTPPTSYEVAPDPILSRGKVLLVTDVCIQIDCIGDSEDYFVVEDSRYGAESCLPVLQTYLEDSGIQVCDTIPLVCGASHGENRIILAGLNTDSDINESPQPIYVDPSIAADQKYIEALSQVSTYAFEHPTVKHQETPESLKHTEKSLVSENEFSAAAEIIRNRTGASSVLFLGVDGKSESSGKAFAKGVGTFVVGMATGLATAGLGVSIGDTTYYLMIYPTHQDGDSRIFLGSLIDLDTSRIAWSNTAQWRGDPIEKDIWTNDDPLEYLFHDVLFQKISTE
mgnify:CR=1 FL=1